MLHDILSFADKTAREAGDILMGGFRSKDTIISYKSRTNLVTNMDRASEEYIVKKISGRFPDHAIIAEEGSRKETKGEFIWYVDPLDATNNYAHGLPIFCVSLGVYSRDMNCVVAGVVYDPFHDELFSAVKNNGAHLNGHSIHVSAIDDIGIAVLATGFPYEKENPEKNNLRQFNRILPHIQGIRRMGSAAIDLSYVACGRLDGYWESELCSWDMAAGSLIVQEAGGSVTRYDGSAADPEFPQIVASNGLIHEKILEFLAES